MLSSARVLGRGVGVRAAGRAARSLPTRMWAAPLTVSRATHGSTRCACAACLAPEPALWEEDRWLVAPSRRGLATRATEGAAPAVTESASSEDSSATTSSATTSSAPSGRIPGAFYGNEKFVMLFTCSKCDTRSARQISKQSFYHGVVLVRCFGCDSLHLVADRLGFFEDKSVDIFDLMRAKGEEVKVASVERSAELRTPSAAPSTSEDPSREDDAETAPGPEDPDAVRRFAARHEAHDVTRDILRALEEGGLAELGPEDARVLQALVKKQ